MRAAGFRKLITGCSFFIELYFKQYLTIHSNMYNIVIEEL